MLTTRETDSHEYTALPLQPTSVNTDEGNLRFVFHKVGEGMLILTRKTGQFLTIRPRKEYNQKGFLEELFQDGPIEFVILKIRGNQVKIGINAHRSLLILRDELMPYPETDQSNHESTESKSKYSNTRLILSQNVRIQRFLKQWSQNDLSYVTGLSKSYLDLVESADINIGIDNVEKLAYAFNLTVTELLNLPNKKVEKRVFSTLLVYGGRK